MPSGASLCVSAGRTKACTCNIACNTPQPSAQCEGSAPPRSPAPDPSSAAHRAAPPDWGCARRSAAPTAPRSPGCALCLQCRFPFLSPSLLLKSIPKARNRVSRLKTISVKQTPERIKYWKRRGCYSQQRPLGWAASSRSAAGLGEAGPGRVFLAPVLTSPRAGAKERRAPARDLARGAKPCTARRIDRGKGARSAPRAVGAKLRAVPDSLLVLFSLPQYLGLNGRVGAGGRVQGKGRPRHVFFQTVMGKCIC